MLCRPGSRRLALDFVGAALNNTTFVCPPVGSPSYPAAKWQSGSDELIGRRKTQSAGLAWKEVWQFGPIQNAEREFWKTAEITLVTDDSRITSCNYLLTCHMPEMLYAMR